MAIEAGVYGTEVEPLLAEIRREGWTPRSCRSWPYTGGKPPCRTSSRVKCPTGFGWGGRVGKGGYRHWGRRKESSARQLLNFAAILGSRHLIKISVGPSLYFVVLSLEQTPDYRLFPPPPTSPSKGQRALTASASITRPARSG